MTGLLERKLRLLGTWLDQIKLRVRSALAGELARALGETVRQVVTTFVGGTKEPETPRPHWERDEAGYGDSGGTAPRDPWDDDFDVAPVEPNYRSPVLAPPPKPDSADPAIAVGLFAARWCWLRSGNRIASCLLGLGLGLLGRFGGPLCKTLVAVAASATHLLGLHDALGAADWPELP